MTLRPLVRLLAALVVLVSVGCSRPPASPPVAEPAPQPAPSAPPPEAAPPPPLECSWIAVVVDNSIPARPQSGISQARLVYEVPTEGMITRVLAFFCDAAPETVGPVRSLRAFMLDLARDYRAVIAHSGGSESALDAVRSGAGATINQFQVSRPFWRVRGRPMPHNLYTSIPALRPYVKTPPAPLSFPWHAASLTLNPEPMTISIPYVNGYHVQWTYDLVAGLYTRSVGQQAAIDALAGTPITAAAVIVQYVHWWQTYEGPMLSSRIDLAGEGQIEAFTAGHRIEGRWRRTGTGPTVFSDLYGQPLQLQPGPVWITLVPRERTIKVLSP